MGHKFSFGQKDKAPTGETSCDACLPAPLPGIVSTYPLQGACQIEENKISIIFNILKLIVS
jgi:hypothetical protein